MPRTTSGEKRPGQREGRRAVSGESIAFLLLAGVLVGLLIGLGLDWLVKSSPIFTILGVFAGFALGLYAVYFETK